MSGQSQRLNVVPTVTMLGVMKARLIGATRGHALLKKKSDALTVQFRQILKQIVSTKESMGDVMKTSSFALTEAKYVAGENIKHTVAKMSKLHRSRFDHVRKISLQSRPRIEGSMPENVVKPRLENTISYIKAELDELEREDFFRLKKIQGYKRREVERQREAAKAYAEEKVAEEMSLQRGISVNTAHDMLSRAAQKDEDIIF
ncbi:hypothetical protein DH2020_038337 [Rehmannia glutinosa]|uniref:V-type proton ATPase subunit D-like protein n=1 Tax=Rehmannia glutinosa TaxID=99300 RepID=A0ABR0V033_REHGL